MMSERQIEREARRVFRRLTEPEAHLRSLAPHLCADSGWGVFVRRNEFQKPVGTIGAELLAAFIERDWIHKDGAGRAHLSHAGLSWYRRLVAPEDPYQRQHQSRAQRRVTDADGASAVVTVNTAESPLTWLRARRDGQGKPMLSAAQFEAGERLRRDFEYAQIRPHVTANWDAEVKARRRAAGSGASGHVSDTAIAAKQRFYLALESVGPELASVLVETCCLLNGLSVAERKLGWPQRSGKLVLHIALNTLARHYGYLNREPTRRSVARHWGAKGYRPAL
ncbi:MAG: DUF6456 domain-containing protein [Hyphomicrobiales bacterium]